MLTKTIDLIEKAFLGQILIRKRLISEVELERALIDQLGSTKKRSLDTGRTKHDF